MLKQNNPKSSIAYLKNLCNFYSKLNRLYFITLIILITWINLINPSKANRKFSNQLIKVIDGDTVEALPLECESLWKCELLNKKTRYRIVGIDTPELAQKPWGLKAKNHLEQLIGNNRQIKVELAANPKDKYGRYLAYIFHNDKLINTQIIEEGYATAYIFLDNIKYRSCFLKAQRKAQENHINIWDKINGLKESPYEFRKKHFRKK